MDKKSCIKNELKSVLKEKYNIETQKIEKSKQSTDGNVYIIYCVEKKYVIKIYKEKKHMEAMVKLHNKLFELKFNIPNIILNNNKESYEKILDKNYLILYSFMEGVQIGCIGKDGKFDNQTIVLIAKELRKFHKNTKDNDFNLPKVPLKNNSTNQSVLHFDLTKDNVFICDNRIGFIDFDDAKYGDSLYDVAVLISNLFFSKTLGVDLQGMRLFINTYYCNDKKLKNEEVPLIKEYALRWIKYILNGNEFDTSTTESLKERYKLIEDNL